ncbi:MAG: SufB/SufD family protein [Ilumatobacteraceae bacterium]
MTTSLTDVDPSAPDLAERRSAAERAAAMDLPRPDQEVWRYSRIGELDLERFRPAAATTEVRGADALPASDGAEVLAGAIVHDVFDELSAAHHRTVSIAVPPRTVLTEPIIVTHRIAVDGVAVYPRLVVDAGEDSEFTVIEQFESAEDVTALVVPRLLLRTGRAARVGYLALNLLGRKVWQIGHQQSVGERDSSTLLATVALGGDYARVRTDARVIGQGASTRQIALYFADGEQMHDFRTLQDHIAPKTHSDLLFKGAVKDRAKSVYTGLIRIGEDARGAAAFQTNRNLTLSEGAWAESVPNLDIRNNDVRCSHASTVGPIDDEQRFYLESRGIEPQVAERLVVLGFFDEVLAALPVGAMRADLRARVATKLSDGEGVGR